MLLEMSYLPAKLRHKMERRQKAKIQLQVNFKSAELKDQIENKTDSCGPDAGLMMNMCEIANSYLLKIPIPKFSNWLFHNSLCLGLKG